MRIYNQIDKWLKIPGTHVFFLYEAPWCIQEDLHKTGLEKTGPDCIQCKAFRSIFDNIEKELDRPNLYFHKTNITLSDYQYLSKLDIDIVPIITIWKLYDSGKLYHVRIHILPDGSLNFKHSWIEYWKYQPTIDNSLFGNLPQLESCQTYIDEHLCKVPFSAGLSPLWNKEQVIKYILGAIDLKEPNEEYPSPPTLKLINFTSNISSGAVRIVNQTWISIPGSISVYAGNTYTLEFIKVSGYLTPENINITIEDDKEYNIHVKYVTETYTLAITSNKSNTKARINNNTWVNIPYSSICDYGSYYIEFSSVDGYTTPSPQNILLTNDITVNGEYDQIFHELKIDANVPLANVSINGTEWQSLPFNHLYPWGTNIVLSFSSVDGYITPLDQSINLLSDKNIIADYLEKTYSINCTANLSGGKFREVGTTSWTDIPGSINLYKGKRNIEFSDIKGYITPINQILNIIGDTNISVTYLPSENIITIISNKAATAKINSGSAFSIINGSTIKKGILTGIHTIEFNSITGFKPIPSTWSEYIDENKIVTVNYKENTYSVDFIVNPISLEGSAKVREEGTTIWNTIPCTLTIPYGKHSFEYSDVIGYSKPTNKNQNITSSTTISGIYSILSYELTINSNKIAKARIDGGKWFSLVSGNTTKTLTHGSHTIEYDTITGYTPNKTSEVVNITGPQTISITYNPNIYKVNFDLLPTEVNNIATVSVSGATTISDTKMPCVLNILYGSNTFTYGNVEGFTAPPIKTINITSDTTLSPKYKYITFTLTFNSNIASQARIDNGSWFNIKAGNTTYSSVYYGSHVIEFATKDNYSQSTTKETINLTSDQTISVIYTELPYIPVGTIVAWEETKIPNGWYLCDGTNNTPNLTNKFILGANTFTVNRTGGSDKIIASSIVANAKLAGTVGKTTLTVAQTPAHTHQGMKIGSRLQSKDVWLYNAGGGSGGNTPITNVITGSHTHTLSNTITVTANKDISLIPPYYTLSYIQYKG